MSSVRLHLRKLMSVALLLVHKDDSDPKVEKDLGENSVIHTVVLHVKEIRMVAALTLCYILKHWLHPVRLYFNPNGDLYFEWEARILFESWCKKYCKTYSSEDEKIYRFGIFKKTLEETTHSNLTSPTPCRGIGHYADQTSEELDDLFPCGGNDDDSDSEDEFYESLCKRVGNTYRIYEENNKVLVQCSGTNASVEMADDEKFLERLRREPGLTYQVFENDNNNVVVRCMGNNRLADQTSSEIGCL